ncbi:DNA replication complex subunit Gins51 [Natrinema gari]|uniref:Gins51 C-terminal domain-containing protein n=1 Tax=Natrinema gari JCM 14663 TaxID=1230459 RepID=L9ZC93_9EURY|nr:hypothetical protein [Natrinema gari]ELY83247.1 hypothetical protein C486_02743 [Natrinema gari JCM 14663]
MNLDELRSVQSKERQKDSLQNLRPSFYQEVGEYIADLEDERDRVADRTDDPFSSPEVSRLTDEIETAKDVVEAIYERRMGKLVKQASLAAAGMPADDEGLTAEEGDLFDDLVERIESNKSRVLDVLEGVEEPVTETDAGAGSPPASDASPTADAGDLEARAETQPAGDATADDAPPAPPDAPSPAVDPAADAAADADGSSGVSPADVMGGAEPSVGASDGTGSDRTDGIGPSAAPGDQPPSAASDSGTDRPVDSPTADADAVPADDEGRDAVAGIDRTTVRITSDIGSILGVDDREYTLTSDDVVTLPEQNAAPLVEREAAERLE